MSEEQLVRALVRQADAYPAGAFGEIGSWDEISALERKVFRAVGKAHVATNLSVFTHTGREEMNDLVGQLQTRLAPGGALAFTFIDPHFEPWPETYRGNNLKWRLERVRETNPAVDLNNLLERSRGAAWCALVDGAKLYVDDDGVRDDGAQTCMTYNVYYAAEFLRREFPRATIRPPVNGDMQHCCIIRRGT